MEEPLQGCIRSKDFPEVRASLEKKAMRNPVDYDYTLLYWPFVKALGKVAQYGSQKYGDAPQYRHSRLEGDTSPINHAINHLADYQLGIVHPHFKSTRMQLAAAAFNCMMEFFYCDNFGNRADPFHPDKEIKDDPISNPEE